ncbi:hypothetical protein AB0M86_42705 [Streptomyces sp. NPDC051639]|uniref:hypothetical protein n=1 Tax=Streptomyces sp. NPDC051639 TaxID=3155671 RepID=UPI00341C4910
MSPKSAYQWHQLWRDGGIEALASRGPGGSRCRLSPRCLEKLAAYPEQGPAAHGWVEGQVWTAARVATLIGRKFSRLLQRLRRDEADAPARLVGVFEPETHYLTGTSGPLVTESVHTHHGTHADHRGGATTLGMADQHSADRAAFRAPAFHRPGCRRQVSDSETVCGSCGTPRIDD